MSHGGIMMATKAIGLWSSSRWRESGSKSIQNVAFLRNLVLIILIICAMNYKHRTNLIILFGFHTLNLFSELWHYFNILSCSSFESKIDYAIKSPQNETYAIRSSITYQHQKKNGLVIDWLRHLRIDQISCSVSVLHSIYAYIRGISSESCW